MLLSYEITSVYRKLTFSVVYTHFQNFSPSLINLVRLLRDVSRYYSCLPKVQIELGILKGIFFKNDCP